METVKKMASYLGTELSDDQIKSILAFTSFENMKDLPSMDFTVIDEIYKSDLKFFFKGKIENWKNYLTDEQSRKIDEMVKSKLTYTRPIKYEASKWRKKRLF